MNLLKKRKVFWGAAIAVCLIMYAVLLTACADGGEDGSGETNSQYPKSSIKVIVPYAAGGGTDVMARAVAKYVDLGGQPMVITNIEGGSSAIGTMEAYNSPNDGYTILCAMPEAVMAYYLGGVLKSPVHEEMEMIASVVYDGNVVSVPKNSQFKSFEDVVKYAEENPGKLKWASVGAKSSNEQASAEIWDVTGIEVNYIPYDSASKSRVAVMGGHADVLFSQISEIKMVADSGDMVPLVITTEDRSAFFPDTPTFKELGHDIINGLHRGFMAPEGTPEEIISILETAIHEAYQDSEFLSLLENDLGYTPTFVGANDLKKYVKERWPIQQSLYELIEE